MKYNLISADTHMDLVYMPGDVFVENSPSEIRDMMPRVEDTDEGPYWILEGKKVVPSGYGGLNSGEYQEGEAKHLDRMAEVGFFDGMKQGIYHPSDPDLRVEDLDIDGVDAEIMYGILEIGAGGRLGPEVEEAGVLEATYEVYNQWVADFVGKNPTRMNALACLTHRDPETAAAQLRKAAEIGLRGAEILVPQMIKPMYHKDWDVLWQTSAECQIPISFHTVGGAFARPQPSEEQEYRYVIRGVGEALFQVTGSEFLISIILSGACQRFPDFNWVLGECGIGWIPYIVERTDIEYADRLFQLGLEMKPSDYWRRQGHSTFQEEHVSMDEVERIGVDSIMWGSDYPHPDGVFPDSRSVIQKCLGHLPDDIVQKITCENAAKLYRFN